MPGFNITRASVIVGIGCTMTVLLITVLRQKRFDIADLGNFVGAFFSGTNIPPALFLCFYVFVTDPALDNTRLKGYEKYISLAGLVLLIASAIAVWKFFKTAWETGDEPGEAEDESHGEDEEEDDSAALD